MQRLGALTQHVGVGVLTQPVRVLTQRTGSEALMEHAGASTQHAGARGVDAGQGADAGPGRCSLNI